MDGIVYEAKTNVLIICAVAVQLICVFVCSEAKSMLPHDAAHLKELKHKVDLSMVVYTQCKRNGYLFPSEY